MHWEIPPKYHVNYHGNFVRNDEHCILMFLRYQREVVNIITAFAAGAV